MRKIASGVISTALLILSVAGATPAQARPNCDVPHPPPVCGDGEPGIEPLEPPTGVVADPNPPVTLRWYDNSSDEAGFRIYRSADGSHWDLVASLPEDIGVRMTYTDGTAAEGVVYRYYVQVFRQDQGGESTANSEIIFALNHLPQGGMFGWHRDPQKRLEIVGGARDPDTSDAIQVQLTIRENRDVIIKTMILANQTIDNDGYFANHEYDYDIESTHHQGTSTTRNWWHWTPTQGKWWTTAGSFSVRIRAGQSQFGSQHVNGCCGRLDRLTN